MLSSSGTGGGEGTNVPSKRGIHLKRERQAEKENREKLGRQRNREKKRGDGVFLKDRQ